MATNQIKVTLSVELSDMVETLSIKNNVSKSKIISDALIMYFKRPLGSSTLLPDDLDEKLTILLNKVEATQMATNGSYRSIAYLCNLLSQDIPEDRKRIARKKAFRNYAALRSNTLTREEYLEDTFEELTDDDIALSPTTVNQTIETSDDAPEQPQEEEVKKPKYVFSKGGGR